MTDYKLSKHDMSYLASLFNHYGSDKDSHGYTHHYDAIFKNIRDKELSILEIGIGTMIPNVPSSMVGYSLPGYRPGGSLRAWRDYFPRAQVVGIDVQPDTQFIDERITTHIANSMDGAALQRVLGDSLFDIIVDDGSHYDTHQLATLSNLWKRVKPGGFYIIEDLTTSNNIPRSMRSQMLGILGGSGYTYYFSERLDLLVVSKDAC